MSLRGVEPGRTGRWIKWILRGILPIKMRCKLTSICLRGLTLFRELAKNRRLFDKVKKCTDEFMMLMEELKILKERTFP